MADDKGKKLVDLLYGQPTGSIRPTEVRSPAALGLSQALQKGHEFVSKPFGYPNPPAEMISEFLGVPAIARTLERLGYGEPLTTGKGMTTKPKEDTVEALLSVAPMVPATKGMPVGAVIKPKGGNWLTGSVEKSLAPLKSTTIAGETPAQRIPKHEQLLQDPSLSAQSRAVVERHLNETKQGAAIDNWVDRNLANYVKKEMATLEDPVRRLAEQGITHLPIQDIPAWQYTATRKKAGFPKEGMGQSEAAKNWENISDAAFDIRKSKELIDPSQMEDIIPMYRKIEAETNLAQNPWLAKVDPETTIYRAGTNELGFDHIIDVLREDLATGRIRPEQLNKVSMEQAVRRTYEYDQELAKRMAEATAAARADLPVYKEYPEKYRWIELNRPGAFASESEAMGHSVRGYEPPKGHPDWTPASGDSGSPSYGHGGWEAIKSGKAKVYSLVDEKGQPHVTVEVGKESPKKSDLERQPQEVQDEFNRLFDNWLANLDYRPSQQDYFEKTDQLFRHLGIDAEPYISQIKGKQNAAPKEEYLPFVQDFVRSGQWSDVGDLRNTGLEDIANYKEPVRAAAEEVYPGQRFLTLEQIQPLVNAASEKKMESGGSVHISNNPDTMRMELAGGGAISKLAKLLRAPAKTRQEIEAIAERMAPQVTGEYVREKPGSAVTVAGKTAKQFEREKTLPVDIRSTGVERTPEKVDIEKLKDQVAIGIAGDPTVTGKTLYGVGETRLASPAPQHGGPLYGLYHDQDHFWASGLGAARRVQNLAREASQQYDAPVVGKYVMMGPESINYAQHFADANLQAIDLSKMTAKQVEGFNNLLRKGSPASGPRPSFPGIEDKESAYLQLAFDPELRKHFNQLMQQPTVTEKFGLPSGQDIRFAITEPELRNLERGVTGYSMGRMKPEVEAKALKLSEHPTYSHDIPGEFIGQTKYPIPYELSFPDTLKAIRENPTQAPHEFGSLKMVGPRQIIDQQLIDEIKAYEERMKALTGKKKGGAIKKADGGEVTIPDMTDGGKVIDGGPFKKGGKVRFTDNLDAMRLAVGRK